MNLSQGYFDRVYDGFQIDWCAWHRRSRLRGHEYKFLSYYGGKNSGPPSPEPMTREEEDVLWAAFVKRRTASLRERLIRRYLCWSFQQAAQWRGPRMPFDDALSAANAGLVEAVERFQPHRGHRFTTYAHMFVRRHLIEQMLLGYAVYASDHLRRLWRAESEKTGKEISTFFDGLSATSIADHAETREGGIDPGLTDDRTAADDAENSMLPGELRKLVGKLPPKQRAVVRGRHLTSPPVPFDVLATRMHVSKLTIRRMYAEALRTLRGQLQNELHS